MKRLSTADPGFEAAFVALLDAPREETARVDAAVAEIIAAVRAGGDRALLDLTARFDGHAPANAAALRVTAASASRWRARRETVSIPSRSSAAKASPDFCAMSCSVCTRAPLSTIRPRSMATASSSRDVSPSIALILARSSPELA